MRRRSWMAVLVLASAIAVAKVWGPFHVSAIGPEYASLTLSADQLSEWSGANKVASVYLAPVLNTPAKIATAIRDDYIRVVYYDGQIADFKIKRWPSSIPVDFDRQVPTTTFPRLSPSALADIERRQNTCVTTSSPYRVNYATGYWGSMGETSPAGVVTIIGFWVDTGTVSVIIQQQRAYCQYK